MIVERGKSDLKNADIPPTTDRISEILAEHFGFAPTTLVDEIINATNDIMYKCTAAVETFLLERQNQTSLSTEYGAEVVKMGIAKLETLMETQVDYNFDKLELYTLRNIFMIPPELVEQGSIVLEHYQHIDFNLQKTQTEINSQCQTLVRALSDQLRARRELKQQIMNSKRILIALQTLEQTLRFLSMLKAGNDSVTNEKVQAQTSRLPLGETLCNLNKHAQHLVSVTLDIMQRAKSLRHANFHDSDETSRIKGLLAKRMDTICESTNDTIRSARDILEPQTIGFKNAMQVEMVFNNSESVENLSKWAKMILGT